MSAKRILVVVSCLLFVLCPLNIPKTYACGHDGVYFGLGYTQNYMVTSEHRLGGANLGRVIFGPGFGGNAVVGYDFPGSRWGIQIPFEGTSQKLNHYEWVLQFNLAAEGVVHLKEWNNGLDFHLVGGVGGTYLTEGNTNNNSAAKGIIASLGPGLSYYFTRTEKFSASLTAEIPFRMVHYFGDNLSRGGTTLFAIPGRISIQFGF